MTKQCISCPRSCKIDPSIIIPMMNGIYLCGDCRALAGLPNLLPSYSPKRKQWLQLDDWYSKTEYLDWESAYKYLSMDAFYKLPQWAYKRLVLNTDYEKDVILQTDKNDEQSICICFGPPVSGCPLHDIKE